MRYIFVAFLLILTVSAMAQEQLSQQLQPLQKFVGKTWRGEFASSTPEKPMIDIAKWERALNGNAIRILHSINDGDYGGETLVIWNSTTEQIEYHYFTTAGFNTKGTMSVQGDSLISHEYVTGNENGITEVKSIAHMRDDGSMHGTSQYFKNGKWVPGHEITYIEDNSAQVKFR